MKTYAIQAGRELRVIVGAEKVTDKEAEGLSFEIARKIQNEMTYPGQIKITVIRKKLQQCINMYKVDLYDKQLTGFASLRSAGAGIR